MTWQPIVEYQHYTVRILKLKGGERYVVPPEQKVPERLYLSQGEISIDVTMDRYGFNRILKEGCGDLGKLAVGSNEAWIDAISKEATLIEFTFDHSA